VHAGVHVAGVDPVDPQAGLLAVVEGDLPSGRYVARSLVPEEVPA
jgi:hypothetical protein